MFSPIITRPRIATVHHVFEKGADRTLCHTSPLTWNGHARPLIYGDGGLPLCSICKHLLDRLNRQKEGKLRLKEHLAQPYEESEFYPVMLYRGAVPLGRVKAIYNYFCASMEMELLTVGQLATFATSYGYISEIAHLAGIHGDSTNQKVFDAHGTRFLAHPEVTKRTPHLHEYLEFLRDEGGLKLIPLRPVPRWTSLFTRRLWRYQKAEPVMPIQVPDFYPYLVEGITLSDDEKLLVTVEQMVPKSIPEQIRGDLCQDIIVGILSGEIKVETLADEIPRYVKSTFKRYPMKYGALSLDLPLTESGFKLNDIIGGSYIDVGMCNRCEEITQELDGGLCARCYEMVEREMRAQAAAQHTQAATLFRRSKSRPHQDTSFVSTHDISLEQWREENSGRSLLSFSDDDEIPGFLLDSRDHEGHDSNRRTEAWQEDPLPYIYDGKKRTAGTKTGSRLQQKFLHKTYKESLRE